MISVNGSMNHQTQWEYYTRVITIDERIKILNMLGSQRWELIQYIPMRTYPDRDMYLFKRPTITPQQFAAPESEL